MRAGFPFEFLRQVINRNCDVAASIEETMETVPPIFHVDTGPCLLSPDRANILWLISPCGGPVGSWGISLQLRRTISCKMSHSSALITEELPWSCTAGVTGKRDGGRRRSGFQFGDLFPRCSSSFFFSSGEGVFGFVTSRVFFGSLRFISGW